jgi:hypothetical protein
MEEEAELVRALLQSDVRGCFEVWKARSDGKSYEGDNASIKYIYYAPFEN